MKARIDWMESGRVKISEPSYSKTSRNAGKYINSSGGMSSGSVEGQHVTEYAVYEAGKTYTFTYWRPSSSSQLCVAFIDSGGNVLSGSVYGGTSGAVTASHTTPAGTVIVRVYGIYRSGSSTYTAEASMMPVLAEGVCAVSEIRLKPIGATTSQLVWPTDYVYVPIQNTAHIVYYPGSTQYISAEAAANEYAQLYVTFEKYLGETLVSTEQIAVAPVIALNPGVYIDGVYQEQFYIDPDDNTKIRARNLGRTAMDAHGCYVTYFHGGVQIYNSRGGREMVVQDRNYYEKDYTQYTTTGYRITVDQSDLDDSGGDVLVTEYRSGTRRAYYRWASGGPIEYGDVEPYEEDIGNSNPSLSVTLGGSPVYIYQSGRTLRFPSNTTTTERQYVVTGSWQTYTSDANVRVRGINTAGRVYSNLTIQEYFYPTVGGSGSTAYSIPAEGGSIAPKIRVSVMCSVNGATAVLLSHQGYVTDGATSVEVANGSTRATINIDYIDLPGGIVNAVSRGTNPDSDRTVVVANSGLRIKASIGSEYDIATPQSNQDVYQQRNEVTREVQGSFHVTAFSVAMKASGSVLPKSGGVYQLNTAASTEIGLEFRASGSGTTTYREYTSGAHIGGESSQISNQEVVPTSLTLDNVPLSTNSFTADNHHNDQSDKNYTIKASYEDSGDVTETLHQVADEKISSGAPTYYASLGVAPNAVNSIWAGGGEVILRATAYHITGTKWKSDNAPVPGESTQTWDTARLTLGSALSGFTVEVADTQEQYKDFRLNHRDMEKSVTTDTASIYAKNGTDADSSATPVTFSVSNAHGETYTVEDQAITWGSVQTRDVEYSASAGLRSLDGTDPMVFTENNPGLFTGDTAVYLASASHVHQQYQTGSRKRYTYQKYTSWSAEHDDDNHRDFISAEDIDPQTRLVSSESVSDSYSVSSNAAWIVVNTTAGTVTLSPQPEDGRVRRGYLIVTNTNDPAATQVSAQRQIVQNAWASLTASPTSYQIGWRGTDSAIISVDVKYTKFSVELVGGWYGASIKLAGQPDSSYVPISPTAEYGNTGGLTQYTLKFSALSPNDPEHNPDGYSMERISNIRLNPVQDGVSSIYLHITQEEYHGGLPNN